MPLGTGVRLGPYEIVSAARRRRHGRGLQGARYAAESHRRHQGAARGTRRAIPSAAHGSSARPSAIAAALSPAHLHASTTSAVTTAPTISSWSCSRARRSRTRLEQRPLPIDEVLQIAIEIADALDKAHRAASCIAISSRPTSCSRRRARSCSTSAWPSCSAARSSHLDDGARDAPRPTDDRARHDPRHDALHGAGAGGRPRSRHAQRHLGAWRRHLRDGHGVRPFEGESAASIIGAILKDTPPPVSQRQPLAPAALDHAVARCLAREPDECWQSAADLRVRCVESPRRASRLTGDRSAHSQTGTFGSP